MAEQFTAADPIISVDGAAVPDLGRDVLAVTIEESSEGLRTCIAHFSATTPRAVPSQDVVEYLDGRPLDFGRTLDISAGPSDTQRVLFAGEISALEVVFDSGDAPHVTVYAEDALVALRQTRRSATYTDVSDADIVRRVVGRHGLTASTDADGPTYQAVQQLGQTDLEFVRERAARIGAELWAAGSTIHLATREKRSGEEVTLSQGRELLSAAIRADLADQRVTVHASGYDARTRDRIDVTADASVLASEVSGGRSGIDVLQRVNTGRTDQRTVTVPLTAGEARALAAAALRDRARRFVTVNGVAAATPQLAVGTRLTLLGVGNPFVGRGYYVTKVRHVFARDAGGLRTHFSAQRPTLNTGSTGIGGTS